MHKMQLCLLCGKEGHWNTLFCPECDEKFTNNLIQSSMNKELNENIFYN